MSRTEDIWIEQAVSWLVSADGDALPTSVRDGLSSALPEEVCSFTSVLAAHADQLGRYPQRARLLMQLLAAKFTADSTGTNREESAAAALDIDNLFEIFQSLYASAPEAAAHVLQCLAASHDVDAAAKLGEIMSESPPEDWKHVGLALSPLWSAPPEVLEAFFDIPRHANVHPATLAILLDLANHAVRNHRLEEHPWASRSHELSQLLASVSNRLRQLEKEPQKFGNSVEEVQRAMGESLTLTVSLCDALGMLGNSEAIPSLGEAMKLSHRRIQCESACALARLGDEVGRQRLIELAKDRVARLRAVRYAEELGWGDEIAPELQSPQALAESELAAWLASPDQFGFPPNEMELLDARTQYWPSYEDPRDCFLFRFSYQLPAGQVSNVGIAGPCTCAFSSDLANLPMDDIYAVFAGWQAEHEEIFEVPITQLNTAQRKVADTLLAYLEESGLAIDQPIALTFFFGEVSLLALVEQDGRKLAAVTDGQESVCLPTSQRSTSLSPELVLCMFRGRKLLRTFNI